MNPALDRRAAAAELSVVIFGSPCRFTRRAGKTGIKKGTAANPTEQNRRASRKAHYGGGMRTVYLVIFACVMGAPCGAQWLKQPTAGVPRNADGKPNLSAGAPRTPDPHTEALRTTERYRRLDFGRMELLFTLDDPNAYAKPWTVKIDMTLAADTEMLEYVCNENEKDRSHMVGSAADHRKHAVEIAPEILTKYAGSYQMGPRVIEIALEQGQLMLDFGVGKTPLVPFSESAFISPLMGRVDFVKDAQGVVTHFTLETVGGDSRGVRRK